MIENTPLVSIVTPAYNAEEFIADSIDSVLAQTYKNWELIIVDDGSVDNTTDIIKDYLNRDSRIKLIRLTKNMGAAKARNAAIKKARGKYLAFLDSDDMWLSEKLEIQLAYMIKEKLHFTFTSYRLIEESGVQTEKIVEAPNSIGYNQLLKNTIIGCLTVMINVDKIGKVLMPNIRGGQDTACWLSILKQGHMAYGINKELALYRRRQNSISSDKFYAIKRTWNIYRNVENLNFYRSSISLIFYVYNAIKKRI